jgi:hypothetical protein
VVKEVIVHAYESRQHGVAAKIQDVRDAGEADLREIADLANASVLDDEGLVLSGWSACAIDHAHMGESRHPAWYTDEPDISATETWEQQQRQQCERSEGECECGHSAS